MHMGATKKREKKKKRSYVGWRRYTNIPLLLFLHRKNRNENVFRAKVSSSLPASPEMAPKTWRKASGENHQRHINHPPEPRKRWQLGRVITSQSEAEPEPEPEPSWPWPVGSKTMRMRSWGTGESWQKKLPRIAASAPMVATFTLSSDQGGMSCNWHCSPGCRTNFFRLVSACLAAVSERFYTWDCDYFVQTGSQPASRASWVKVFDIPDTLRWVGCLWVRVKGLWVMRRGLVVGKSWAKGLGVAEFF